MPEPLDDSDLLNRLTILHWHTAAELAKVIAIFRRRAVSVTVAGQQLRALERAGKVERRPRQEPWGYGVAEFRLADNGRPREPSVPLWSPHRPP